MRGLRRCCKATVCARSAACRRCVKPPKSANMTAKMSTMSGQNPESIVMNERARAPRLVQIADGLATAVAVSLPWSTSATSILIALWLIALVPTLDASSVRREVLTAAGGLPLLLWALGAIGMLWADVSWSDRIAGLSGFHKLLFIPLLLAQFRRSGHAKWAILGFLASSVVLLLVSWALVLTPGIPWRWRGHKSLGVPVKDYIMQSVIFAICAFGLLGQAADLRRRRRQPPDRTADRVLEEIAGFHRRGASHRPWNGDNPGAIPTRHDGHDQSRADHHEPAQPDPGGDDRARPRRRRRARRDVARPSRFVF